MALRKFTFLNPTEGFVEEQAAGDELSLGKITLSGVSGVAIDAGGARVTNLGAPTAAGDATTKSYVDAIAQGVRDFKASVRAVATSNITLSGTQTIDGVSLIAGDRVLVTGQTTGSQNGIYVVAAGAWSRSTDADESSEVSAGMYVLVEEGTAYADSAWVLTTDDPITLGTTSLAFVKFTTLQDLVAGAGLTKTGSQIDVGAGNGIAVDADAVRVLLATNPGLQFNGGALEVDPDTLRGLNKDATGLFVKVASAGGIQFDGSGDLEAKLVSTGGLQSTVSGLSIKINDTPDTLDTDASGLKVVGLPSLFKVNGTAVGAAVTAPNLDTLTNGSVADALHSHTEVQNAIRTSELMTANGALAAGDAVYWSANNQVSTGDCTIDAKSRIIGITVASAANAAQVRVVSEGTVTGILSGATVNTPYYLGSAGQPVVYGSIPSAARVVLLGYAKNATDLDVNIQSIGKKA
jgi:hypothetical protein